MASKIVILGLLLLAVVGMVSAANPAKAPAANPAKAPAADPAKATGAAAAGGNDDAIGNTDDSAAAPGSDGIDAVAAPIGSAEEAKSHGYAQAPSPGGASTLGVSVAAGAAAMAGYFVL